MLKGGTKSIFLELGSAWSEVSSFSLISPRGLKRWQRCTSTPILSSLPQTENRWHRWWRRIKMTFSAPHCQIDVLFVTGRCNECVFRDRQTCKRDVADLRPVSLRHQLLVLYSNPDKCEENVPSLLQRGDNSADKSIHFWNHSLCYSSSFRTGSHVTLRSTAWVSPFI